MARVPLPPTDWAPGLRTVPNACGGPCRPPLGLAPALLQPGEAVVEGTALELECLVMAQAGSQPGLPSLSAKRGQLLLSPTG